MPLITGSLYVSGQAVASLVCGQMDSDGGGQKALAATNRLLRCSGCLQEDIWSEACFRRDYIISSD